MYKKMMVLMAAVALVLGACGNDDTPVTAVGAGDDPMAEPVCILEGGQELLPEYVGLSEAEATERAADQGFQTRVVGADGECFAITMDLRDDRVNIELADDVVIAAAIF